MKNVCEKCIHFYFSHALLFKTLHICIAHKGEKSKVLMTMKTHICLSLGGGLDPRCPPKPLCHSPQLDR